MKTVTILLSTYNGEKYLEEQLMSIFNQTYWKNCTLFVRDDGSTDNTIHILKKHENEGKLILNQGENIGFCNSFFWLIKNAPKSDYYSLADQDDIWYSEKIERAVACLDDKNINNTPALYYCNFDFFDENMKFIGHHLFFKSVPTFDILCTQSCLTGMTFVFNESLRKLLLNVDSDKLDGHDYFISMVASGLGKLIGDDIVTVKYRRFNRNASPSSKNGIELLKWRLKRFVFSNKSKILQMIYEYKRLYYSDLSQDNKHFIDLVAPDNHIFFSRLRLLFYPKRLRKSLFEEIALRILLLGGKI